jgi:transcription antitermination factor NusB
MPRDRENRSTSRLRREAAVKLLYACDVSATSPADLSLTFWQLAQEHDRRRLTKTRHTALRQLEDRRKKAGNTLNRHKEHVLRVLRVEPNGDTARHNWSQLRDGLDAIEQRMAAVNKALQAASEDAVAPTLEQTLPAVFAAYRKIPGLIDQLEDEAVRLEQVRKAFDPLTGTLRNLRRLAELAAAIENPTSENLSGSSGAEEALRSLSQKQARIWREQTTVEAVAEAVWGHSQEIDAMIEAAATNYRLERIEPIDRCILRLAIHEMLHDDDIPPLVAIDEAIEVAKIYGTSNSSTFINGVLDRVLKEHATATEQSSGSGG